MPVRARITFKIAKLDFKIKLTRQPSYLSDLATDYKPVRDHRSRRLTSYYKPVRDHRSRRLTSYYKRDHRSRRLLQAEQRFITESARRSLRFGLPRFIRLYFYFE